MKVIYLHLIIAAVFFLASTIILDKWRLPNTSTALEVLAVANVIIAIIYVFNR
jgi:hypothetical protein